MPMPTARFRADLNVAELVDPIAPKPTPTARPSGMLWIVTAAARRSVRFHDACFEATAARSASAVAASWADARAGDLVMRAGDLARAAGLVSRDRERDLNGGLAGLMAFMDELGLRCGVGDATRSTLSTSVAWTRREITRERREKKKKREKRGKGHTRDKYWKRGRGRERGRKREGKSEREGMNRAYTKKKLCDGIASTNQHQ